MDPHFTYFLILGCAFAGPLLLSFDKKVAFYKKWKRLFLAMIIPALLYIVWDIYFTSKGIWSFNEKYYVASAKIFGLPLEEILFFFVIPYSCVFIYECIRIYFPRCKHRKWGKPALTATAASLLVVGIYFFDCRYTSWTFISTAAVIAIVLLANNYFRLFDPSSFIVSYSVVLIPFLIVNGFLTAIPVVQYNDAENIGARIYTIPVEDVFYGMLLVLMNILIFEKLRSATN
ncbi:MAG TPA: lycopene cyclase domain-containing protein [Ferruginibacter sp.]|nr:lycopene cyclase domain-containing protein [Ferruginibacter sp.]